VPWINATIFAMEFPHEHDPGPSARAVTGEAAELERALFDYRNEIRAEFGLSPVADEQWVERYWSKRCVLLASSPHFSRPILDRFPQVRMTGFWFDDRPVDEGSIDPGLRAFLDSGPAPIVLSFSSLPLREPGPVVRLHVEAARSIGMRLVIQRGWGGLEASAISENIDISHVCFTDHVPHSWLLARVSAVVHHGGIGTTAMALRHGCPMLVEPYCNDQFFNSGQVAALGVGAAVSPEGLSIEILGELLGAVVFDPSIRRRADELATLIRSERGLDLACELVDGQLPA
jgi:UDP:flavonoid glycosyltransferase YjiC (YdhE family)